MLKKTINILKLIYIHFLPVNKKRIVFTSYNGKFNDNSKYIYYQFLNNTQNIELIWLVDKKTYMNMDNKDNCFIINSIKGKYYYGTAHIIIDNNYGNKSSFLYGKKKSSKFYYNIEKKLKYKKKQLVYTTWHGTALKRMGRDQINSNLIDFDCKNTTMILGDQHTLAIMKHLMFEKVKCILLGSPRNDILNNNQESITKLKNKLNLPLDKKILLFAPTFRSYSEKVQDVKRSGIEQIESINFDKLFEALEQKFGSKWIFVARFHYHVEKMIDWDKIKEKYGDKVINGNSSDDMSEYLACTDILLTDVSSCMFDFMCTNRPTFLFFPDYKYYSQIERGLYIPMNELPFQLSENFEGLIDTINSFDKKKYNTKLKAFKIRLNVVENKNSAKDIMDYIIKDSGI